MVSRKLEFNYKEKFYEIYNLIHINHEKTFIYCLLKIQNQDSLSIVKHEVDESYNQKRIIIFKNVNMFLYRFFGPKKYDKFIFSNTSFEIINKKSDKQILKIKFWEIENFIHFELKH